MHGVAALLACGLMLGWGLRGWPSDAVTPARCAVPVEAAHAHGWSTDVRCESSGGEPRVAGPARLLFGIPLDLNESDAGALEVLPRIGPARARAIVAARIERRFARVEDLQRIRGIGPATVRGLVGLADVGPLGTPVRSPVARGAP